MRAPPTTVALIALVALATACSNPEPTPTGFKACTATGLTSVGESLPSCSFEAFPGAPVLRLADLKGKPAVINFWASWCKYCIEEMPGFQRVFASLGGKVSFVGMNVLGLQGETKGAGQTFAKRTGARYLLAFDPGGLFYSHFGPSTVRPIMPITVFVGADLLVKERHFGPLTQQELRALIRKHLGVA